MHSRIILLTHIIPTLSVWNVWDLPLWSWLSYRQFHDAYVKNMKEGGNG